MAKWKKGCKKMIEGTLNRMNTALNTPDFMVGFMYGCLCTFAYQDIIGEDVELMNYAQEFGFFLGFRPHENNPYN